MRKITVFIIVLLAALVTFDAASATRSRKKKRYKPRTHRVVRKRPMPRLTVHDVNPFVACEDTCHHVHGIDISHYQNDVFWQAIGDHTNMAYVYLKATEGGDNIDPRYEHNIELAHSYGIKVGSYHYFRPTVSLESQLKNFKTQCLPAEQDLIPMIDVETTGNLTNRAFCDSLTRFLTLMEDTYHQKPLVYTYRNFYNTHLVGRLDNYQLMVAMYADEQPVLADGRDYTLWQYTCKGRIQGISGAVDKSRVMNDHSLREIFYHH